MLPRRQRELANLAKGQRHAASRRRPAWRIRAHRRDTADTSIRSSRAPSLSSPPARPTTGHAAGGHFAVDDATILEPGECQVEVWRESADEHRLARARRPGMPRRTGRARAQRRPSPGPRPAVADRARAAGQVGGDHRRSARASASSLRRRGATATPHYVGASLYAPLSVRLAESLRANVNVGRDWLRGGASLARGGIALEWQATPAWVLDRRALSPGGRRLRPRRRAMAGERGDRLRPEPDARPRRRGSERVGARCHRVVRCPWTLSGCARLRLGTIDRR